MYGAGNGLILFDTKKRQTEFQFHAKDEARNRMKKSTCPAGPIR